MNRREFLQSGGKMLAFTFIFASPANYLTQLPTEAVAAPRKTYRGTRSGNIEVSSDGGKSWHVHSKFGQGFFATAFFKGHDGRVHAQASFKQHGFNLVLSKDEKAWLSQSFQIPLRRA
jgi:hypothetical protein